MPRLEGCDIKETTAANGEGGKRGRGRVESRSERTEGKKTKDSRNSRIPQDCHQYGFAAAATVAKPGAYVLVIKFADK